MLDQLALTEFGPNDQLTLLVFVDQVMAQPFKLESEERAMGKTNMREFFVKDLKTRKRLDRHLIMCAVIHPYGPTADESRIDLISIKVSSMRDT